MIKKIPLPMAGLILGLLALGNLLQTYSPTIRWIFGAIGIVLYMMFVLRLAVGANKLTEELKNPVVAGVFATFPMATMLISTYLKQFIGGAAYYIWLLGILMHIVLILWFTVNIAAKKDIKTVFPTWFIMYVGIVVASVTTPAYKDIALAGQIGQWCFWFGFVSYIILIPTVCYRMFVVKNVPEPAFATNVVFTAPGGLLLAGYMSAFAEKNMSIVMFLLIIPGIFYIYSLVMLPKVLKLKFYPSISAITFPTVITAIGFKMANAFFTKAGNNIAGLPVAVKFLEIVATFCILYALAVYVKFLTAKEVKP